MEARIKQIIKFVDININDMKKINKGKKTKKNTRIGKSKKKNKTIIYK